MASLEDGPTAENVNAPLVEKISPTLVTEVRAYLDRHRIELMGMLASEKASGAELARRHTKIMDGLLTALYPVAFATMKRQRRWAPVLLAAVGGYGRGFLGLKSDLDVRLLTTESPERIRPIAEA